MTVNPNDVIKNQAKNSSMKNIPLLKITTTQKKLLKSSKINRDPMQLISKIF